MTVSLLVLASAMVVPASATPVPLTGTGPSVASAAVVTCAGTTVRVTINGKVTCVASTAARADVASAGNGAATLSSIAGVRASLFPNAKTKPGVTIPPTISATNLARLRLAITTTKARLVAVAPSLFGAKWPTKPAAATAIRVRPLATDVVTIGKPSGSIVSQSPGKIEVAVSAPISVTDAGGKSLMTGKVSMNLGATASSEGTPATTIIGIGVEGTVNEEDGVASLAKTNGFGVKFQSGVLDPCPSPTGVINALNTMKYSSGERVSGTLGPIKIGYVNKATTGTGAMRAVGQMGPDARLSGIKYTYSAAADWAQSGNFLAVVNSAARAGIRVSATGVLDPTTGLPRAGSKLTVSTTVYGTGQDAAVRAALSAKGDDMLREALGRLLADMRTVETNARAGKCTTITLSPASVATLQPGATLSLHAVLKTNENQVTVTPVRWGAVAAKGAVAPGTSQVAQPTFTVKGAAKGPQTASLTVKAVSAAGISTVAWQATGTSFPASYSGHVTYSDDMMGLLTTTWDANAVYTFRSSQNNPDGSRSAWYDLTSLTVGAFNQTSPPSGCVYQTASFGPAAIVAGDIEIQVDAHGVWSAGVLIDGSLGQQTMTCPPPLGSTGGGLMKAFLNTRTSDVIPALRLIPAPEATTPISGTNATNLESMPAAVGTASASWNLVPTP